MSIKISITNVKNFVRYVPYPKCASEQCFSESLLMTEAPALSSWSSENVILWNGVCNVECKGISIWDRQHFGGAISPSLPHPPVLTHLENDKIINPLRKCCIISQISLIFFPNDLSDNIPALVKIMDWHRSGNKPLSETIFVYFTDAYMRHSVSICWLNYFKCIEMITWWIWCNDMFMLICWK